MFEQQHSNMKTIQFLSLLDIKSLPLRLKSELVVKINLGFAARYIFFSRCFNKLLFVNTQITFYLIFIMLKFLYLEKKSVKLNKSLLVEVFMWKIYFRVCITLLDF